MNKKKTMSGISKKGKRRENRNNCALYAEQIYEKLTNYFSSTKMEVMFLKTPIERLSIREDPKWLTFEIDGVFYEIKMCAYKRHMETFPDYSYQEYYGNSMRYRWHFSVCYNLSSPQDVREMVILAHNLRHKYSTDETIAEMEKLAHLHNITLARISFKKDNSDELLKLFVNKHQIEDDRFGITYYVIQIQCHKVLRIIDREDNDDWDEEDDD